MFRVHSGQGSKNLSIINFTLGAWSHTGHRLLAYPPAIVYDYSTRMLRKTNFLSFGSLNRDFKRCYKRVKMI